MEGLSTPMGMPGPRPLPLCHLAASAAVSLLPPGSWKTPGEGRGLGLGQTAGRTPPLSRLLWTGPWRQRGRGRGEPTTLILVGVKSAWG